MVVTIVVLLILAGVTISLLLDENGIIQKSKDAKKEYKQAQTNEQIDLDNMSDLIDEATAEKVEPENIADWEYTEEEDGTITLTSYKGTETTVVFPNYINGKKVKKISGDTTGCTGNTSAADGQYFSIWNKGICNTRNSADISCGYTYEQGTITKAIVSPGIEEIEGEAFQYSYALEEVTIAESVRTIGKSAFFCCPNLKKINIPKKIEKLEENIFYGCDIENIIIPDSVKSIEKQAFMFCIKLSDIYIPKTVENIGEGAFFACRMLTNIKIPESVTSIGGGAFDGCESLTNITIPSSKTTMGAKVFSSIPSITVNVPFKEGETPEGWDANWNGTNSNCVVTVNYLK